MLEKVFSLHDVSKSPNIEIFSHFKDYWPSIDQATFSTAMGDETTAAVVTPWKDNVIHFAIAQLNEFQPRDDYHELLELTIIFLGATPPRGIKFQCPGALHRARWMARAIYSIKMWLFRSQFAIAAITCFSWRISQQESLGPFTGSMPIRDILLCQVLVPMSVTNRSSDERTYPTP